MSLFDALFDDLEWRPIADYDPDVHGGVLLASSKRILIGEQVDGVWHQHLDAQLLPLSGFEPDRFAEAHDHLWPALAMP